MVKARLAENARTTKEIQRSVCVFTLCIFKGNVHSRCFLGMLYTFNFIVNYVYNSMSFFVFMFVMYHNRTSVLTPKMSSAENLQMPKIELHPVIIESVQ